MMLALGPCALGAARLRSVPLSELTLAHLESNKPDPKLELYQSVAKAARVGEVDHVQAAAAGIGADRVRDARVLADEEVVGVAKLGVDARAARRAPALVPAGGRALAGIGVVRVRRHPRAARAPYGALAEARRLEVRMAPNMHRHEA